MTETNVINAVSETENLEDIEASIKELEATANEVRETKIAELVTSEADLKAQLKAVRESIKEYKKENKGTTKGTKKSTGVPRHKGKGFGGADLEELILASLSPTGTRMIDVVTNIKSTVAYDGNQASIPATIGSTLIKMANAGKIQKLEKRGLYAPLPASVAETPSVAA